MCVQYVYVYETIASYLILLDSLCSQRRNFALCGSLVMALSMKVQGQEQSNYVYFTQETAQKLVCEAYYSQYRAVNINTM